MTIRRARQLVALALTLVVVAMVPVAGQAAAAGDPGNPPLAPGQCVTLPQVPGHVLQTVCRLRLPSTATH